MDSSFKKPEGLIGRFGVIKLWPDLKAAEDENLARIKIAAASLGLECVEITPDARLISAPGTRLTQADLDFVIHLHFETPKAYDIFSFVALWNPVQFYHDWGYKRFSRNLLTHDDFLSCSATGTDDHIRRMIAHDTTRKPPQFTMYHSLSQPILEPKLGDRKIFYAGINWERLGKKKGRHQELLDRLDPTGAISIYGPTIFQGVEVWKGYKSYSGPIPFDGVSILHEINRCGIALVLSSEGHKQSELMSNRLFESLAAGAFVICDENPFASRYFGDTLLYVDTRGTTDQVFGAVMKHVQWIRTHADAAQDMARKAQAIFRERFSLDKSLIELYSSFQQRCIELERLYAPAISSTPIEMLFLMPTFSVDVLDRHIGSIKTQRYSACHPTLLLDVADLKTHGLAMNQAISKSGAAIAVRGVVFREVDETGNLRRRVRLGEVVSDAFRAIPAERLFCIVAPDEELFSDHIQSLAGALERNPNAAVAHSNALYRHTNEAKLYHDLQEELDFLNPAGHEPLGFGRFLFRRSAFADHIHSALRYVDGKTMALLTAVCSERATTGRATVIADIQSPFNVALAVESPVEMAVIRDYCPDLPVARHSATDEIAPRSLSLNRLSETNRQSIAVELAHSIPLPAFLKSMLFGVYRLWLRRRK